MHNKENLVFTSHQSIFFFIVDHIASKFPRFPKVLQISQDGETHYALQMTYF